MASNTYIALDKVTVSTPVTSIDFTSVNQNYTDLIVVINGGASVSTSEVYFQFNNDTTTSYSFTSLNGNGTTAASNRGTSQAWIRSSWYISPPTTYAFSNIVNLQNYSNATTYKTVLCRSGTPSGSYPGTETIVGLWRNTAAISSIKVFLSSTNTWNSGSTFSLYGIAAAPSATTKATGGYITEDATYYYHLFTGTGTFTPLVSLSADVMTVGGGGGGSIGGGGGGGGGAGALNLFSTQSLSATNYAVTVGAGGAAGASGTASNGSTSSFSSLVSSAGGGRGAGYTGGPVAAGTGGSGGGGGNDSTGAGAASGSNTNIGGTGFGYPPGTGGGGGGATAAGQNASSTKGGNGGQGYSISNISASFAAMFPSMPVFASGGGGGCQLGGTNATAGVGGTGAGNGAADGQLATQPTSYGSGGGGGSAQLGSASTAGYQGVVIVRYAK